jgi:NAD(P)-dependent dehydrogenase (short-subunit alcohol dehydrogenase family)
MKNTTGRIGLVTGANKGIGYEVARQLAASGCTILIGARNQIQGEEAAAKLRAEDLDVQYVPIDLDDLATIATAARKIDADFGRLDILINNAGIAAPCDGPPSASSLEAIERDFRVNFIGTVAVTQAMLPLLRKRTPRASSTFRADSARSRRQAIPPLSSSPINISGMPRQRPRSTC